MNNLLKIWKSNRAVINAWLSIPNSFTTEAFGKMGWDSITIEVNLKLGSDAFECYTCDFTHDYIDINADYRN